MSSVKNYKHYILEKQLDTFIKDLYTINEYQDGRKYKFEIESKKDAETLLDIASNKLKEIGSDVKKQYIKYIMAAVIGYLPIAYITNKLDVEPKHKIEISHNKKQNNRFDATKLHISKKGIDIIKDHEKLKLRAYAIGDGKITIGYGSAFDIHNSPYKVGDRITKEKAIELLKAGIKRTEDGIRRMALEWKKEGIDLKLTQSQYDAIISIAYNTGIRGFRRTELSDLLKQGKFKAAAERIKNTAVSDKFSGSYTRREAESDLFKGKV